MQQSGPDPRNNSPVVFARGVFGEIFLPAQAGTVIDVANKVPNNFWARLKTILGGDHQGEIERALYEEIIIKREPLSLSPPNSRPQRFESFAPVLTHLGNFRWRMGLVGHGRLETFLERDVANAVNHAQKIYQDWFCAEASANQRSNHKEQDDCRPGDEIDEI